MFLLTVYKCSRINKKSYGELKGGHCACESVEGQAGDGLDKRMRSIDMPVAVLHLLLN